MKKQFDIKYRPQIESGEYKVVTRKNLPARIICWDAKGMPIVALVEEDEDVEVPYSYNEDGSSVYTEIHDEDLFVITPEPELTEFEEHLQSILIACGQVGAIESYKVADAIKLTAKGLLEYAKKELQPKYDATKVDEQLIEKMVNDKFKQFDMVVNPENTKHFYKQGLCDMYRQFAEELEEAFNHQDEVVYNNGYEKGFKQLFNSIPHWKNSSVSKCSQPTITSQNVLFYKGYFIHIDELFEKLPKDEQDNN